MVVLGCQEATFTVTAADKRAASPAELSPPNKAFARANSLRKKSLTGATAMTVRRCLLPGESI
jgi:hypothetical protein